MADPPPFQIMSMQAHPATESRHLDGGRYRGHAVTRAQVKNGVRELRDHATADLSGSEPVAVSKHGRVIGFYLPVERAVTEVRCAVAGLVGATVNKVMTRSGLSETGPAELLA